MPVTTSRVFGLKRLAQGKVESALPLFAWSLFANTIFEPNAALVFQVEEVADTAAERGYEAGIGQAIVVGGTSTGEAGYTQPWVESVTQLSLRC